MTVISDAITVPKNDFDQCRDFLTLSKQDIQSLNHDSTRRREAERQQTIAERTYPILIEHAKKKEAAKKVFLNDNEKKLMRCCT